MLHSLSNLLFRGIFPLEKTVSVYSFNKKSIKTTQKGHFERGRQKYGKEKSLLPGDRAGSAVFDGQDCGILRFLASGIRDREGSGIGAF